MAGKTFRRMLHLGIASLALLGGGSVIRAAESTLKPRTNIVAQPLEISGVHNAFRASPQIYSGSQPEGDAAFAAIAKLGVKTIVSVDGSKPDIEAARKHGLRYIHLPYGYDGIPTHRVVELAKLSTTGEGPFFVHCHHGLHRGPAAVAVMCETAEGWSTDKAVEWLRQAGTSADYPGLYRAASSYKTPTKKELAAIKSFPEVTQTSTLVEAMVKIDEHLSNLKRTQKAGWKTPPGHADLAPAHEATMLWEQLKEIARTADTAKRSDDYRARRSDAEQAADALRNLLRDPQDLALVETAFKKVGATCGACHKKYRNE